MPGGIPSARATAPAQAVSRAAHAARSPSGSSARRSARPGSVELGVDQRRDVDPVDQQRPLALQQPRRVDLGTVDVDGAHHGTGQRAPDEAGTGQVLAAELARGGRLLRRRGRPVVLLVPALVPVSTLDRGQVPPDALGDDRHRAVDHLDRALVVEGVGGHAQRRHPPVGSLHRVHPDVRVDREVDDAQGPVAPAVGTPGDERLTDPGGQDHAARAQPDPHGVRQRRQQVGEPGLAHPVGEVGRVTAVDQQRVRLLDPGHPALAGQAGQRGELEDAERGPPQVAHPGGGPTGEEAPGVPGVAHRVPVGRGRDGQRRGLGDGLAEEGHEGLLDAGVGDPVRGEQELHTGPFAVPPEDAAGRRSLRPTARGGMRKSRPVRADRAAARRRRGA